MLPRWSSKRFGVSMFAAGAIGCSLIDPLDGISDGTRGSSSAEDGGVPKVAEGDASSPSLEDAGTPSFICLEIGDPNDPNPREIVATTQDISFCGTVTAGHPDVYFFDIAAHARYVVDFGFRDGTLEARIEATGPDESQTGRRVTLDVDESKGGRVVIRIQTPQSLQQQYFARVTRP